MRRYDLLFWDFDGVVKDSIGVKADAFVRLMQPCSTELAHRIRAHHECNGGLSRFEKIPQYLQWAGIQPDQESVARYCEKFSMLVCRSVIESAWVPGAREYLEQNHERQACILLTATPEDEMHRILHGIGGTQWFRAVYGAAISKSDAIGHALAANSWASERALMIGDSETDQLAARSSGIGFLLRRTQFNVALQNSFSGPQCENFLDG